MDWVGIFQRRMTLTKVGHDYRLERLQSYMRLQSAEQLSFTDIVMEFLSHGDAQFRAIDALDVILCCTDDFDAHLPVPQILNFNQLKDQDSTAS